MIGKRPSRPARLLRFAVATGLASGACGGSPAAPPRAGAGEAATMERTRCGPDDDDKAIAPVLAGSAVEAVQPLYGTVEGTKSGPQSTLRGVTVRVSALPGVTAEWLDRALECHSAKETLGHSQASADPFWVPGSVVDIDVRSAKDGFDVFVTGSSPSDAKQILDRASAFAKEKTAAKAP